MTDQTASTTAATPPEGGTQPNADSQTAATTAAATETTQTTDTTLLGDKPAEAPTDDKKVEQKTVPEAYEFKMPDGVELDKAAADEFSAIAKEMGLDQEQAQKVADVGAKMAQRQAEAHARQVEAWVGEVKADKEIGGDKLDENLGVARKALDTFGTPELRDLLNASGMGNHPAVIKAFYKVGKAISEDGFVKGSPPGASTDPAKTMFPSMN